MFKIHICLISWYGLVFRASAPYVRSFPQGPGRNRVLGFSAPFHPGIERVGAPHTAGSDALSTLELFFKAWGFLQGTRVSLRSKPCEFVRFLSIAITKPYKLIGFW